MPDRGYILITGASGFLGTWLASAAHDGGFLLTGIDIVQPQRPAIWADFATHPCDRVDYSALVGSRKLYAVFHLAGSASVPQSVDNPLGDFASLLPGTVALLAYIARYQPQTHLVLFSSAAVYGNPERLPVGENAPVQPVSPYGIHKAAAESLIQHYARLYGFRASILRLFSAYGEGLRKQVIWDLCRKALSATATGEKTILLHGTGNETRDFIHASDVARAALAVTDAPPSTTRIVNIASGTETSIRTLGEHIASLIDPELRLQFNGAQRPGDPKNWRADVELLASLGFSNRVAIKDGLANYVRWVKTIISSVSAI